VWHWSKYNVYLLKVDFFVNNPANLNGSGINLQAYVGRTQISRVKILAPWAKAAQNGGEKGGCFVMGTMNLHLFVRDSIKFERKTPVIDLCWTLQYNTLYLHVPKTWQTTSLICRTRRNKKRVMKKLTRMWGDAQRNGRPAEYTWRLLRNLDNSITCIPRRKLWLKPTARVPCSNAANIECKTLTQNEFCRWQNSVRRQEPPKMYI